MTWCVQSKQGEASQTHTTLYIALIGIALSTDLCLLVPFCTLSGTFLDQREFPLYVCDVPIVAKIYKSSFLMPRSH